MIKKYTQYIKEYKSNINLDKNKIIISIFQLL